MEEGGLNPKTPKLPPSLTFIYLWSRIPNLNVKGFLNRICFSTLAPSTIGFCCYFSTFSPIL